MKKILYISYDSINDPISESQILPVLKSNNKDQILKSVEIIIEEATNKII